MSKVEQDICQKIKLLRERAGLTQAKLAETAGLSEETIGAMERGKYVPSIQTLDKLAAAFGIDLYQLFRPDERKKVSASDERVEKITAFLRGRNVEDIETAERLLKLIFKRVDESSH